MGDVRLSTEARCLTYNYPVHEIGEHHQPSEPRPVHLLVYREHDEVHFLELNVVTMRMLQLLESRPGKAALDQVVQELKEAGRTDAPEKIMAEGSKRLAEFARKGILRHR